MGWWHGHQFGIVPRACIEAVIDAAEHADHVSGPTSVAVFAALAVAAGRDGAADGGMAGAARMLGMNAGVVRRIVATCLEPAGVATRTPAGVLLHTPDDAASVRSASAEPQPAAQPHPRPAARPGPEQARPTARSGGSTARPTARLAAATPSTSTEKPTEPPCSPPAGQLALADPEPPAALHPVRAVHGSDADVWFAEFWTSYPRKAGKGAARTAWAKARKRGVPPERIVSGARRYAADPNRQEQFTAHPATWLNQERWDDDPLPARGPASAAGRTVSALAQAAGMLAGSAPAAIGPSARELLR